MKEDDYRKRFYDEYITTQWQYTEEISQKSYNLTAKVLEKHISAYLPKDKSVSILDIACGTGHLLYFLQNKGYYNSRGIDLGDEQLEIARKMGVKNVEKGNFFEYLKKSENQFYIIVASHIIEHLKKEEALEALDLIYKSLKPKGKILLFTPNAASLLGIWLTFSDFTHELVFTSQSVAQLLRVCNFSNLKIYGFGPVIYDFRSGIRTILWNILKMGLKFCFIIERGTGRSIWASKPIFESTILGVGQK